jgi:hypothetical protein
VPTLRLSAPVERTPRSLPSLRRTLEIAGKIARVAPAGALANASSESTSLDNYVLEFQAQSGRRGSNLICAYAHSRALSPSLNNAATDLCPAAGRWLHCLKHRLLERARRVNKSNNLKQC